MRFLPAALLLLGLAGATLAPVWSSAPHSLAQEPQAEPPEAEQEADDPDDLRRQLGAARRELEFVRAKAELDRLESAALEMTAAREAETALAELADFESHTMQARTSESELGLMQEQDGVDDARDEMQQLAALYGEGDLADRTAEIVLRRAQRGLDRAEESLRLARADHHHLVNTLLPREQSDLRAEVRAAEMELRLIEVRRRVTELEHEHEVAGLQERIAELEEDLKEAEAAAKETK